MIFNQYLTFKNNLVKLNKQSFAIVKIMFFYNFSSVILNTFFGAIIYKINNSLMDLLIYSLIMICVADLSFILFGVLISIFKLSMKKNYYFSIIVNTFSYIWLVFNNSTLNDFYIFGVLHGISIGSYWLSLHTYELTHTKDEDRDFYASVLSLGTQILKLLVPFLSTIIFFISIKLFDNEYLLLLYIIPLIYIFSLKPLQDIEEFEAQKLFISKFKKELFTYENKIITIYTFFDSFKFGNLIVLNSYVTIIALNSLLNIGIATTIFSIITLLLTGIISNYRNLNNRIKIMFIGIVGVIFAYIPLYYEINIYTYIWWSLMLIIFNPLYEITSRVINLYSMEKMMIEDSFYTSMIYRTLILWLGRVFSLSLFIYIYSVVNDEKLVISIMITMFLISYLVEYVMAKKILQI